MRIMSEHQEQATFFQFVRLNRKHAKHADLRAAMELCYAVPNGPKLEKQEYLKWNKKTGKKEKAYWSPEGKWLKTEGLTEGILDVNLDWPSSYEYFDSSTLLVNGSSFNGLRLEFKYRNPHEATIKTREKMESGLYLVDLSKKQKEKRELLLKAGYEVKVVYLAVQAIRTVFEYLPFDIEDYQGIKEYL